MNRLVLIDGNAILHRAYHALPPLTAPDGSVVNAVYGFASMLMKLGDDLRPTHIAVAFDRAAPTFRKKLFVDYQASRPPMEETLVGQVDKVHALVESFGIPVYEQDGFEADDVIGTIAHQVSHSHAKHGDGKIDQVVIVTGDRDIFQLVRDDRVLVFMPTKGLSEGKLYGENDVKERMGVGPQRIPDFKALAGDPSDNYPGVPGIGPKTAVMLIDEFGTVESLYKALANGKAAISEGVKNKLVSGKESAALSKTLATIRTDVPIAFDAAKSRKETLDTPGARDALASFHFSSLLRRLTGAPDIKKPMAKTKTEKATDANEQQALF
jgi:DNA polymerase-1